MNTLISPWPPHITVAAVIEREGKFLLVEEISDGLIVYNQPAGHLEPNESILAAISRETLEETGWEFSPKSIVGIYFYQSELNQITYQRICFAGKLGKQTEHPLDVGIIRSVWLSRDEIIQQAAKMRSPMVLQCIDDYLAKTAYPLNLITDLRL